MEVRTDKLAALEERLRSLGGVAVAFSGGVDSALLLFVAHRVLGGAAHAVTVHSELISEREHRLAMDLCERLGIECHVLRPSVLGRVDVAANGPERCYHCKHLILEALLAYAHEQGLHAVVEGSNADDDDAERPGSRAVRELGVLSPLREVGLRKDEIRALARHLGLPVWSKPSTPCLATRIPCGTPLSIDELRRVERAEDVLLDAGLRVVRVRSHNSIARIETDKNGLTLLVDPILRTSINKALKALGYEHVTLDLEELNR
jgi:uncharacterized protein